MSDIVHQIAIDAAPRAVFPLVASGRGMAQWWAGDVATTPDGGIQLGFLGHGPYRLRPQTQLIPARAVWACDTGNEWANTQLSFELIASGTGTTLRFRHADWKERTEFFVTCNTAWGALMYRLKAAAEGRNPGPLF